VPEEEETVKANHRKAVEEVTRAILKNPDGAHLILTMCGYRNIIKRYLN